MRKTVPPSLMALGKKSLPAEIRVLGLTYQQPRVFKNDFFAVTAMYDGPTGPVLLKVQRQARFLLLPMRWLGRLLAAREHAMLQHLADVKGVPRFLCRWESTGLIREYIPGHALQKGERVPDDFHARLRALIGEVHRRGMAYVDLEKCENVLVGDDGRPYLFDFQISWYLPVRWGGRLPPARLLRSWLQRGDLYHLAKLQRRTRPDQMSPEALAASHQKPWYTRVYTRVTRPLTWMRRQVLNRVDPRRKIGERGRVGV